MRILLLAGLIILGCNTPQKSSQVDTGTVTIVVRDTVTIFQDMPCNDDSVGRYIDSIQGVNDKLAQKLLHSSLIIKQARYYVAICNRNPSQTKFLRGWMNRVLE